MNTIQLFHTLTFYAMYAGAAIAVFLIVERQVFFLFGRRDASRLLHAMRLDGAERTPIAAQLLARKTVPVLLLQEAVQARHHARDEQQLQDLGEAIYIASKTRVNARLWVLDTIVTAAPLLGLVGTILGIIDTFAVLASSGISDPSGVSKGIGTALYATALGISIALGGLLFYNYLRECADHLNDQLKQLLLRAFAHEPAAQQGRADQPEHESGERATGVRHERHAMQAVR